MVQPSATAVIREELQQTNATSVVRCKSSSDTSSPALSLRASRERQEHEWELESLRQRLKHADNMARQLVKEAASLQQRLDTAMGALEDPRAASILTGAGAHHRSEKVPCVCREMTALGQGKPFCNAYNAGTVGSAHVCTFVNASVCLTRDHRGPMNVGRSRFLFRMPETDQAVPIKTFTGELDWSNSTTVVIAGMTYYGVRVYRDNAAEWDRLAASPVVEGSTVLYSSRFVDHITHVLEGAGSLHLAVSREKKLRKSAASRGGGGDAPPCHPRDPYCLGDIRHLVMVDELVKERPDEAPVYNATSWHQNVLRIFLDDAEGDIRVDHHDGLRERLHMQRRSSSSEDVDKGSVERKEKASSVVCFEKATIPSFYYGIFPDGEDTAPFQQAVERYLALHVFRRDTSAVGRGGESSGSASGDRLPLEASRLGARRRTILLVQRSGKRTIVDFAALESFVRRFAEALATASRKPVEVAVITFGHSTFAEQAAAAARADIMMGLHGADLTNMIFMRRGSVLIELNPLFFFENRFFELANNLGLHYLAWTCTHEDCAFGGAMHQRFRALVAQAQYHKETRTLEHNGKRFVWPADRPVGLSCPLCNDIVSRGGVFHSGFMQFRDSDVRVSGSLAEIQSVLNKAVVALGWLDP
jgi:hypothetical protein